MSTPDSKGRTRRLLLYLHEARRFAAGETIPLVRLARPPQVPWQVGERLWLAETWQLVGEMTYGYSTQDYGVEYDTSLTSKEGPVTVDDWKAGWMLAYRADDSEQLADFPWRSSATMPHWASRFEVAVVGIYQGYAHHLVAESEWYAGNGRNVAWQGAPAYQATVQVVRRLDDESGQLEAPPQQEGLV